MTANLVTVQCLEYLTLNGYFVWRNNAIPVRGRTFRGLKGVPDIIGFNRRGRFIGVEIKVGRDKMSEAQSMFEVECRKRFAIYLTVGSLDDLIRELE